LFTISEGNLINEDATCPVIVTLMQKYSRQKRAAFNINSAEEYIQFGVYKVIGGLEKYRKYFEKSKPVSNIDLELIGSSGIYLNQREVTGKFSLPAGSYLVIPSCFDSDIEGEFLIRIFTAIY